MNQDHTIKDADSQSIARHVEEYLQRGGTISAASLPDYAPTEKQILRA